MMPEQAEWTSSNDADAPAYLRRAMTPLRPQTYDERNDARMAAMEQRIAHLEAMVHRLLNPGEVEP